MPADLLLYSIGHSNLPAESLLRLLQQYDIQCLADVRSFPVSRFNKQFNRELLAPFLEKNDIAYFWMGDSLGGRREDLQSAMGFRQEALYSEDPLFQEGIAKLLALAALEPTAIMCSEEDPRHCHRHRIIGMALLHHKTPAAQAVGNIQLLHIRSNGQIEDAANIPVSYQPPLF